MVVCILNYHTASASLTVLMEISLRYITHSFLLTWNCYSLFDSQCLTVIAKASSMKSSWESAVLSDCQGGWGWLSRHIYPLGLLSFVNCCSFVVSCLAGLDVWPCLQVAASSSSLPTVNLLPLIGSGFRQQN